MEERKIICCGAGTWTRVIGWFGFVGSALSLIIITSTLNLYAVWTQFDDIGTRKTIDSIDMVLALNSFLRWLTALSFLLSCTSVVMGAVLLWGSYRKNTRLIYAWMVYVFMLAVTVTGVTLVNCLLVYSPERAIGQLVGLCIYLPVQVFVMWVVDLHKNEIEAATEPEFS
ncbi:unnamed protein product [Allacma fusca]|uniref:Uncharacterized protein n=1 Tax=Allacma fusca TaxID=39272 RepID=A0A8J2L7C9_9HEXA|nr:unnamed protein product [Allacma fusca]